MWTKAWAGPEPVVGDVYHYRTNNPRPTEGTGLFLGAGAFGTLRFRRGEGGSVVMPILRTELWKCTGPDCEYRAGRT